MCECASAEGQGIDLNDDGDSGQIEPGIRPPAALLAMDDGGALPSCHQCQNLAPLAATSSPWRCSFLGLTSVTSQVTSTVREAPVVIG